jgi:CHAT domain-containing protein
VTDFLATEPRDCELIHFACHGDTQQQGGFDSDLLMQGRMIGTQYQPDKFSSDMVFANLRFSKPGTSPVVFLNSCRTGQVGLTITGAGGFAQSFLNPRSQQGAGIFVGAQWSISDSTALTFAKTFYGALLAGKTLIDAATEARAESRKAEEFTWLAYTIYGDPLARVAR